MKIRPLTAALLLLATPCFAGFSGDGFGARGFQQYVVSSSVSNLVSPMMTIAQLPGSGSATQYSSPASGTNFGATAATSTVRRLPIPIAGSVSRLSSALPAANATASIKTNINGTAGNVTCAYSASSPFNCTDTSHSDHLNSGDLMQWQWSGTWSATAIVQYSSLFTADNGQQGFLLAGPNSFGIVNTTDYLGFGSGGLAGSDLFASSVMPDAYVIHGLYAIPNATEAASNPHLFTVYKNGSATAMTCTDTGGSAVGCCVNDYASPGNIGGSTACTGGASTISVSLGDTLSIQVSCPTTPSCGSINPGVSLSISPVTTGHVPITAEWVANWTAPSWVGAEDNNISSSQNNFQLVPASASTITFANLIVCSTAVTGAGAARTVSYQSGSAPGVLPTTGGSPPSVSIATGGGVACPGANAGSLTGGGQDTTHSLVLNGSQTIDSALTLTATPGSNTIWKISSVATVQ